MELAFGPRSKLPLKHNMSKSVSELGTCPFCESVVSHGAVLIKYETDGEERLFAECYECGEPVQPQ